MEVTPCLSKLYMTLPKVMDCNAMPDEIYWVAYARNNKNPSPRLLMAEHTVGFVDEQMKKTVDGIIRRVGPLVVYPLPFLNLNTGFLLRSYFGKEFNMIHATKFHAYMPSWWYMNWSKKMPVTYGKTWVLCEGIMDAEIIGSFYPFVLAYLSSGPSRGLCEWLSTFTNSVIVCPDRDEAGMGNYGKVASRFKKFGVSAQRMLPPEGIKDAGDIARLDLQGKSTQQYKDYFNSGLSVLLGG